MESRIETRAAKGVLSLGEGQVSAWDLRENCEEKIDDAPIIG